MAGALEDLEVELRPHKGIKNSPLGPIEIEHNQWIVVIGRDGMKRQAGYMRKAEGAPLLWIPHREDCIREYGIQIVEIAERKAAYERDKWLDGQRDIEAGIVDGTVVRVDNGEDLSIPKLGEKFPQGKE